MLRLLTFGGLRVVREDGTATELANQRRRLAVLVVAAAAAPAGVSREKLLFLLWPDADSDKGRHALSQIVYNLRRELGTSPVDGIADLALIPEVMTADLTEFRAAVAAGDHATVAALYTGPFLDGFFVPGATEFERWAEEERARTTRQAMAALDKLVAGTLNDPAELVRWTGRLVELEPLSARRVVEHMRALERLGDREAAIAYGRRHEALSKADGDETDAAVLAEVERLRAMPTVISASIPPSTPALPDETRDAAMVPAATDAGTTDPTPADVAQVRRVAVSPRAGWRIPLVVGTLLTIGAAVAWARMRTPALPLETGARLLLADVQLPAVDSANARALAVALQSALQQSSRVQFVSPASITDALRRMGQAVQSDALPDSVAVELAEREGARYVVALAIAPTGAERLVTLRVLDPGSGNVLRTYSTTTPGSALLSAIDDLAGQLRGDLGDSAQDIAAAIPLPKATTSSLEALKLLASARSAYNRALYTDAIALYDAAIALDTAFAAAHAGLAESQYALNNVREGDAAMSRALALAGRLPPRERLLIEAAAARGHGDWIRAATLHRAYLIRYPDDYDVYAALGFDLMRAKDPEEAMAAYDSVRAHRTLSANVLINIGQINLSLRRWAAARAAYADAIHLDTTFLLRNIQNEQVGTTLLRLGHADSARAVFTLMLARNAADQARGHRSLAYVDLYEGRYASAVTHLTKAIELGQENPGGGLSEIRDRALLASTYVDLGKLPEARAQLRAASALCIADPQDPRALLWTGKPAARVGDTTIARILLDSARVRARPTDRAQMSASLALEAELLVARGAAADGVAAARRAVATDSSGYVIETLAFALERAGKLGEARALYVALASDLLSELGKEAQQLSRLAPIAVARIDAQLGRAEEARRALGQFAELWPSADQNLPMITTLRARIAAQGRP